MINYDLKKIRAIVFDNDGVLSRSIMNMDDDGLPRRTVNVKDGYALQFAVKCGLHIAIITGAHLPVLCKRYAPLGITDVYLGAAVKTNEFEHFMARYGLQPEEVLYMGDDIPDYEVMQRCGLPCCPADAAPEIRAISTYISDKEGGCGCVRDVIEQVLRAQGHWMTHAKAFGW